MNLVWSVPRNSGPPTSGNEWASSFVASRPAVLCTLVLICSRSLAISASFSSMTASCAYNCSHFWAQNRFDLAVCTLTSLRSVSTSARDSLKPVLAVSNSTRKPANVSSRSCALLRRPPISRRGSRKSSHNVSISLVT